MTTLTSPPFDYLIVGAGLFGATMARQLTDAGKKCLVVEKRSHIAGNCYTELSDGIHVHKYGPHIFHTSNEKIWDYVRNFADFNHYRHRVHTWIGRRAASLPINLNTFGRLLDIHTPDGMYAYLARATAPYKDTDDSTVEGWCLKHMGLYLYETLIRGYTEKQWNRLASDLPASIIKRLPMRDTYDNDYFNDPYQGIPINGYTAMVEAMLYGIEVWLNTDYLADRTLDSLAEQVVYSGPIDELFDCDEGKLEYRSLRFEEEHLEVPNFQGVAQMNYADFEVPWTRIVEHKHFTFGKQPTTIITREYPDDYHQNGEPYYPINDEPNTRLAKRYIERAEALGYIVGGRLSRYTYWDMHQVIGQALTMSERILQEDHAIIRSLQYQSLRRVSA